MKKGYVGALAISAIVMACGTILAGVAFFPNDSLLALLMMLVRAALFGVGATMFIIAFIVGCVILWR